MNPIQSTPWNATLTLVLWVSMLTVGLLGFSLPYHRPQPQPPEPELPPVEVLDVELASEPEPISDPLAPAPDPLEPPPLIDPITPPDLPPMPAVAELTDTLAFALPVEGPVRIVEIEQAARTRAPVDQAVASAPAPAVQTLIFGSGEGRQPAPRYPRQAVRERQEGAVTVVFSVGADGRVIEAQPSRPSPWPLLNEEAVRVIQDRWRFERGPIRRFEVTIRFELNR
ncbi:MAG TPA: hypothetical protein DCY13_08550 [Verrucomicrobiales bacterium]|nr:hypothetical protein [Verrucomicrobiales bacterium]